MSSRKFRSITLVVLAATIGTLAIRTAEAAQVRSGRVNTGLSIREALSVHPLLQSMRGFLHAVVSFYNGPPLGQNPGHHPPANNEASREGPGVDPHGGNRPPNPGG